MNSFAETMVGYNAPYKAAVIVNTFGHLFPKRGELYSGSFLFVHAGYGGAVEIITSEWHDLDDSPLLYEDMKEYMWKYIQKSKNTDGKIFKFTGTYRRYKNGKTKMSGKVKHIKIQL